MKKILKYSILFVMGIVMAAGTGCTPKELDTNQFEGFTVAAIAPNPVMRGAELHIVGHGLEDAVEVKFAGDVTVTDIKRIVTGERSEIAVTVPLEGPEVGKVTVVGKDGKSASTKFDLTFTEPITVDSFTPATALSGDVITIKGEYLNVVKTVIFAGEVMVNEFESQSRHELKVKVPADALSGAVIVSDVDEINDDSTIPNRIYAPTELKMGNPKVNTAQKAVYKSGQLVKVTGTHLDMIKEVNLPNAAGVEFTVNEAATELSFVFPKTAVDGAITLVSFEDNEFSAGEFEAVVVTDLTVTSMAEDGRFKANNEVKITGSDLDLVTKVEFGGGAESSFYFSDGAIFTHIPATAKDGAVTVTMDSGAQAYSEDLEVVKPVITAWDEVEEALVAGVDKLAIEGNDLDLVTSAKIGNKAQSFIDCEFAFDVDEAGVFTVVVDIPRNAYSGPITLTSAAGYETATNAIPVAYDEAVSIKFDTPSFGLGRKIAISGKNLLQIEQVFIKGKKVTDFAVRSDNAMAFAIPDKIGPGVYRLDLVLVDGTELTWPIPFEITAPYTETFIWEGSEDLGNWGPQPYLGADGALADGGLEIGDIMRIYYEPYADWWQFEIFGGHWEGMSFPELGGGKAVKADNQEPGAQYFAFEVTEDNYKILTSAAQGWGGVLVVQGESVVIKGLSIVHFGEAEQRNVIWEGSHLVDWTGDNGDEHKSMSALSWGGYDWGSVEAGTTLALTFDLNGDEVQIRLGNGNWAALPGTTDPYKPAEGELRVELTAAMIAEMVANGGLVITGQQCTLKEVALITTGGASFGRTVWEGNADLANWSGNVQLTLEQIGEIESGSKVVITYSAADGSDPQFKIADLTWTNLPGFAAIANEWGVVPVSAGTELEYEYELTDADIEAINNNKADWGDSGIVSGLVIYGQQAVVTQIAIK